MKETTDFDDLHDVCLSSEPFDSVTQPLRFDRHPKLKRFAHYAEIEEPKYVASGQQGTVFRFKCRGKDLCLKLFKEWRDAGSSRVFNEQSQKLLNPFNGTFAVRCHGWMTLTGADLARFLAVDKSTMIPPRYNTKWAIVKDYIPNGPRESDLGTIIDNLQVARQAWLLPEDIKPANYKESFLVDLGNTKTFPTRFASAFEFHQFYEYGCKCLKSKGWLSSW
ncbi:uncharacterized protein TRUGW13939_00586 [Talaromyces rugulosus]|uniref:Uncharacterized protein n=1 Tax=Talaromyces rugulosus TaxID=121627 RepID=A0A7H8QHQ3_TALRU|nr:uncharacterized protein TRUGW13939_00586 [Talaromyces rugulosus]QKX53507.1 hypothetical protein TRUGW13939_00586 [Talaromyces rugulosus]